MSPAVLVASEVPEPQRAELRSLCASLDLEALDPSDGDVARREATVVIGSLPAGARIIPPDLLEALSLARTNATVLLLASEPLVRPVVTLEHGRVVVVGSSASSARLRGILQMVAPGEEARTLWRPALSSFAWSAHTRPVCCSNDASGFVAVVPFGSEPPPPEAVLAAQTAAANQDVEALAVHLRRDAGLVWTTASAGATPEWGVYWPRVDRQAWLHSSVRLPNVIDVRAAAAHAAGHLVRFAAHSGDVCLLLSHPVHRSSELALALAEGGPAVIERLEGTAFGLVVEVR